MGPKTGDIFKTKRRILDKIFSGYQPCELAIITDVSGIISVRIIRI
jgi:hypothetical protein